jgi:hypothetical protein
MLLHDTICLRAVRDINELMSNAPWGAFNTVVTGSCRTDESCVCTGIANDHLRLPVLLARMTLFLLVAWGFFDSPPDAQWYHPPAVSPALPSSIR